jgi:hypothetical protein
MGWIVTILLTLGGCTLPQERIPLKPLPEDTPPLPYAELLTRARYQATAATEAFFVNKWGDLEDAAKGLEQTARFLTKAEEVPMKIKPTLQTVSEELRKESLKLREAAKSKDAKEVNTTLQRLNLQVRELRLE